MDSKYIFLFILLSSSFVYIKASEDGSYCSEKCKNKTSGYLFRCSCSKSCGVYGDCCYDSEFRPEGRIQLPHMCLSYSTLGRIHVISGCPKTWSGSSRHCIRGLGRSPPVTSRRTGMSYINIQCATCHTDDEEVVVWNVTLKCCSDSERTSQQQLTKIRFFYKNGNVWSKIKASRNSESKTCHCVFEGSIPFADSLELRYCDERLGSARCSPSWVDKVVEKLCTSYADPQYIGDEIYRNHHCALCNYMRLSEISCKPRIVESMLSQGMNISDIMKTCEARGFESCLQFFHNRGNNYRFSELTNISELSCIPSSDLKCCKGEKYHFRAKRCMKLIG